MIVKGGFYAFVIWMRYNSGGGNAMDLRELLGFMGGLLTNVGFVPQIWRLLKLKSAHEVSLPFISLFIMGISCWLAYGIVFGLFSIIVWNGVAIILGSLMLYAKLKYGR